MISPSHRRWFFGPILFCLLFLAGCVHYGQFRTHPDPDPNDPKGSHQSMWRPGGSTRYYLGFVEVDEFGELFDREQLNRAMNLIQTAKADSPTKNAIVVTFIHGWKNNASDGSGNVWGFRDELKDISEHYPNQSVVGIYIGWRGAVTEIPVIKEFSFYDRRNAAIRIPSAHLTETLERIMHETKSCIERCSEDPAPGSGSISIIVGHSFGGMVLERSLTQSLVGDILRQEAERKEEMGKWNDRKNKGLEKADSQPPPNTLRPPADLIALVNEAAPATEGKQLLDLLKTHKMKLTVDDREEPLLLSITSEGDAATGLLMPLGQYPSKITKQLRKYEHPDPPEIPSQSTYYLHTTAHLPALFSHLIGLKADSNIAKAGGLAPNDARCFLLTKPTAKPLEGAARTAAAEKNEKCRRGFGNDAAPDPSCYCIVPAPNRYNDTPYWVMQMPKEFVPDHSTIFRPAFRELLAEFITTRVNDQGAAKPAQIRMTAK